jgi:sorting nexin-29
VYKVFSNVLCNRLAPYVERVVSEYQCGFCRGRSAIEQIFKVYQILGEYKEVGIEMHHLFIGFKAACDSKDSRLCLAVEEMLIPKKLVNLVRITVRNMQYQIRTQSTLSEPLPIKNGVCEGDALACLLF